MMLTVGSEEGRREEAFVRQRRKRNDSDHVVCVKGQTAERLTAQLLSGGKAKYTKYLNTFF